MTRALQWLACASLVGLIVLCLAWELWLAPLRPGGSWLALKALPLLLPLFGLLRGRRYTYQWAWILGLACFTEGVVRAWSESGLSRALAWTEIAISLAFFTAVVLYARASGLGAQARPG
jgi:uncharacterized membrane protein